MKNIEKENNIMNIMGAMNDLIMNYDAIPYESKIQWSEKFGEVFMDESTLLENLGMYKQVIKMFIEITKPSNLI